MRQKVFITTVQCASTVKSRPIEPTPLILITLTKSNGTRHCSRLNSLVLSSNRISPKKFPQASRRT